MKRQQIIIAISMASALLFASKSYGRIGEGYSQCVARYGKAVAALPGLGHILGIAGFEKSGIAVTALFDRPNRQCFLIMYTRADAAHFLGNPELKEAQIESLMASLNVSWVSPEEDGQASRQSSIFANKPNSSKTPSWKKNMELALNAAKSFMDALGRGRSAHLYEKDEKGQAIFDNLPQVIWLTPFKRSGNNLFVFKLGYGSCNGLLIMNSDAANDISNWAEAYKESLKKEKDKGRPLEGF